MNREKVIRGLECCLKESDHLYSNPCNGCPYEGQECIDRMKADAIALLKEQEVVKIEVKKINSSGRCGRCPNCLMELNEMDYPNYCGFCGRAVKWE